MRDGELALKGAMASMASFYGKAAINDPEFVRDRAKEFSDMFAKICGEFSVPAKVIFGFRYGNPPPPFASGQVILGGNYAVLLTKTGKVVEWTARQYDSACPVPLVASLSDWRKEWRELGEARRSQEREDDR